MGMIDDSLDNESLVRVLVYGQALTRKTTWALKAAEAGFNIIYFGFDHNFQVAGQLSPAARKRIFHFDMRMPESKQDNNGALSLVSAAQPNIVYFDEAARNSAIIARLDPEISYTRIDLTKCTSNDIIVIDSWTAFVSMLNLAQRPILDAKVVPKLEWDDYAKVRLLLDLFIKNLMKMAAHVIVIGHAETYAKRKPDAAPKAPANEAVEQIRLQVASVTRSHAETLPKEFTDVLFFETQNSMVGPQISSKGSVDFDAGCRRLAPFVKKFDDFQFVNLVPDTMLEIVKQNVTFSSEAIYTAKGAEFAAGSGKTASIPVGTTPFTIKKN